MFAKKMILAFILTLTATTAAFAQSGNPFEDLTHDYDVEARVPERIIYELSWVLRSSRPTTIFEQFDTKAERTERISELQNLPGNFVVNIRTSKTLIPASRWLVESTVGTRSEAEAKAATLQSIGLETRIIAFLAKR